MLRLGEDWAPEPLRLIFLAEGKVGRGAEELFHVQKIGSGR